MSDCIFCKIIKKEIPSQSVYENEQVIVIKDIQPAAPVHLLVIPKRHIDNICDPELLGNDLSSSIIKGIQEVTQNMKLRENGFRVVVNYGSDAGEAVPHLHWHILAGRKLAWPPG
jgi:Diadenosine tetraphosphate (Ap4A) hydrolase and other HIT family hydrolases